MTRGLRSHLSYASVMATIAVFIALGGTGYAATKLARNSVGSTQIQSKAVGSNELQSRAVTSSKLRSGSVTTTKLSQSARAALRGSAGSVGPQGPAGAPAITLRASINSGGGAVGGNAQGVTHNAGGAASNEYGVSFGRPIDSCTAIATLAGLQNGAASEEPAAGRITVANEGGRVLVKTFAADGTPAELPFNVVVAC